MVRDDIDVLLFTHDRPYEQGRGRISPTQQTIRPAIKSFVSINNRSSDTEVEDK